MKKYKDVDVSEKQLEDFVRQAPDLIEAGIRYIGRQKDTDRGPLDVLMVDSGGALIVCELKIAQDDGMLFQGIDYLDYVSKNIEAFSRLYEDYNIDPTQSVRLFLIAPRFSVSLLNRLKWIDIQFSLFVVKCIQLEKDKEIIPVYTEVNAPTLPPIVQSNTLENHLNYITDSSVKKLAKNLIKEVKSWDAKISIDPTMHYLSMKSSGSVFASLVTRRKYFTIYTYDRNDEWSAYKVEEISDLGDIEEMLKDNALIS